MLLIAFTCHTQHKLILNTPHNCLMFVPCIIRHSKNNQHMHWIVPLLYSMYRLPYVSAVVCHHQEASWIHPSYLKCRSNMWYIIYCMFMCYTTYSICISSNSEESKKLPDNGRPLPKHVGACILNKGVVQFSACVGCFCYITQLLAATS
jgi:hypothetical protein